MGEELGSHHLGKNAIAYPFEVASLDGIASKAIAMAPSKTHLQNTIRGGKPWLGYPSLELGRNCHSALLHPK